MAVDKKILLETPLSTGLAQKSDRRSLPEGAADLMVNCVRLKNGAVRKRFGHTALSKGYSNQDTGGGTISRSANLFTQAGRLYLSDWSSLYTYSDEQHSWSRVRTLAPVGLLDRLPVLADMQQIIDYDIGVSTSGLLVVVAAFATGGMGAAAFDMTGGTYANAQGPTPVLVPIVAPSLSGATLKGVRLTMCGNTAIATAMTNTLAIVASKLDLSVSQLNNWSASATLVTPAAGTSGIYDVVPIAGDATRFAILYELAAVNSVRLDIRNVASLASTLTKDFDTQANFNSCASMTLNCTNNGHYWIAYTATAGAGVVAVAGVCRTAFYNENGGTQAAPVTVSSWATGIPIGKMGMDATEVRGAYLFQSTGYAAGQTAMSKAQILSHNLTDVAGVATATGISSLNFNMQLATRPWISSVSEIGGFSSKVYVGVILPSTLQGTHYLAGIDFAGGANLVPFATLAPRLTKAIPQPMVTSFTLPHVAQLTGLPGSVTALPLTFATQTFRNSLAVQLLDFLSTRILSGADLGGSRSIAAALPAVFDGGVPTEFAFLAYPELPTLVSGGGGGSLSAGTYQYIAIYESRDQAGQVHRSATSVAQSVVAVANDSIVVKIPSPALSLRTTISGTQSIASQTIYAALYRTTVNGTLFYRVTPDPPTTAWQLPVVLSGISITDTMSDAALTASATAQLLYTTGGVLDNFTPPAARCGIVHKSRFVLAGCDDPTQVWPSKALTSGESPGYNEAQNFNATGAVRAHASMDDKLVLFVQRGIAYGIEYVTGDGPTDSGTQSDWSPPQSIASDVGAVDQRGTCAGPFGVLFRSPVGGPSGSGGIHLLTRDLQVQYLSGPVEDTLVANPVVTSMVLHPNAGRVYVTCVPADSGFTSGVRLVWDYANGGTWSMDQVFDADTAQASAGARSACVAGTSTGGPAYHWVTAAGRVYRETNGVGANSYTDAGTWVPMTLRTAWQKPAFSGIGQYWAVQAQSDSLDPADLTMTLTFDYAPSSVYNESKLWTAGAQATFDRFPQVDVEMLPGQQKAKAVQVTLADATPTGGPASTTGQGASWATITIEYGPDDGRYPNLPPAQRA